MSYLDDDPDYDLGNGCGAWAISDTMLDGTVHSPAGLIIEHEDGCASSVLFNLPGAVEKHGSDRYLWDLKSLDPLHIEPSIMREGVKNGTDHDHHGFIREGKWIEA